MRTNFSRWVGLLKEARSQSPLTHSPTCTPAACVGVPCGHRSRQNPASAQRHADPGFEPDASAERSQRFPPLLHHVSHRTVVSQSVSQSVSQLDVECFSLPDLPSALSLLLDCPQESRERHRRPPQANHRTAREDEGDKRIPEQSHGTCHGRGGGGRRDGH